jgi:hypothetical protein
MLYIGKRDPVFTETTVVEVDVFCCINMVDGLGLDHMDLSFLINANGNAPCTPIVKDSANGRRDVPTLQQDLNGVPVPRSTLNWPHFLVEAISR